MKKLRLSDLKDYLDEMNISQTSFSQEIGITVEGLRKMIFGVTKRPHDITIRRMEEVLGMKSGRDKDGIYFYKDNHVFS